MVVHVLLIIKVEEGLVGALVERSGTSTIKTECLENLQADHIRSVRNFKMTILFVDSNVQKAKLRTKQKPRSRCCHVTKMVDGC